MALVVFHICSNRSWVLPTFPIERFPLLFPRSNFIHRRTVVQSAVLHDVADRCTVVDIVEWILVHDDQVGEFAGFERAKVFVQTNILRAVERCATDCLHRSHASLHEHPQLPMGAKSLKLSMRSKLN